MPKLNSSKRDEAFEAFFGERRSTRQVFDVAKREGAAAFDIPGAPISHEGGRCGFDTLIRRSGLDDPALATLALIVRGADTDSHDQGMIVHDALYVWAQQVRGERHAWRPETP